MILITAKSNLYSSRDYEESIGDKFNVVEKTLDKALDEVNRYKDKLSDFLEKRKSDQDDNVLQALI